MGLFGLIKNAGDRISVSINEWMGTDFLKASIFVGVTWFATEFITNFIANMAKLKGSAALALKYVGRAILSGFYYYTIKDKTVALGASMLPISVSVAEGLAYLLSPPEQAAKSVASMLGSLVGGGAPAVEAPVESAPVATAAPVEVVTPPPPPPVVSSTPAATTPAPAEQGQAQAEQGAVVT
jgi:hypothetical protein